jgi:hypothetical protein
MALTKTGVYPFIIKNLADEDKITEDDPLNV